MITEMLYILLCSTDPSLVAEIIVRWLVRNLLYMLYMCIVCLSDRCCISDGLLVARHPSVN